MMAPGHRAAAVTAALGIAQLVDAGPVAAVTTTVLAVVTAAGPLSPDADNREPLRGLLGHRGATHWWGWPVTWAAFCWLAGAPLVAYGPAIGLGSHVLVDAVWGKGGKSIPRGVPLWPVRRGHRIGLGWRVVSQHSPGKHALGELVGTGVLTATALGLVLELVASLA